MKHPKIVLEVTTGNLPDEKFVFDTRTRCTLGRGWDCNIRFPSSVGHANVSRHHCLLDIDPPGIRVRDLGSRNGTFVNGERIGQRPAWQNPEEVEEQEFPERALKDGDLLQVGHTCLRVEIADPI